MTIAILGCGPTGLLAAHACTLEGYDVAIFSRKRKSELFGSQYLHNPIPGLTPESDKGVPVKYVVRGTPEEYRRKTHGKWWDGHIGQDEFEPDHQAWDIRQHYDMLWRTYVGKIEPYSIPTKGMVASFFKRENSDVGVGGYVNWDLGLSEYELVISTVPRDIWQLPGDEYIYSEGWAIGDAPERGVFVDDLVEGRELFDKDNTIICDGTSLVPWTRLSKVHGFTSIEWPHHAAQPHTQAVRVRKPLHYTPGPHQNGSPTANWLHVGRYGQFEKGVVVTDAFDQVTKKLKEMQ
ncbi:oxidoreductase [Gordonia phage Terapin]|nr:oxidoreductase [Gordonia phage Terapin]AVP43336.1 oxidoreductase [Gordonia phage Djokovic]QOC56204.1 oxidoreductase [Gordonia phage Sienna]QOC56629.1 oxidoreductase [Gordonia phage BiteSize]QYW00862.1 oxidoreductase [Gordonia phage Madi]AOE44872.1 oxidoreductase [Gordonia phage Terapin]